MSSANLSTHKSLKMIVVQFVMILAILLILAFIQSEVMTGVRAYVRAEGLYAKGHMLAIQHLQHFTHSRDPEKIQLFNESIAIPIGDRIARQALQQDIPDQTAAYQGFLQGGNDPQDIPSMIRIFIYFQDIQFFREAIAIWEQADVLIEKLDVTGQLLIQSILSDDQSQTQKLINDLEVLNDQLVDHEINFSKALAEGSHWVREILLISILSTLMILGAFSALLTSRLMSNISKTEEELESHKSRLELIVHERTHQLENVIEGTNAGTWRWNLVNNQVEVNEKWLSMIGYSLQEIPRLIFSSGRKTCMMMTNTR